MTIGSYSRCMFDFVYGNLSAMPRSLTQDHHSSSLVQNHLPGNSQWTTARLPIELEKGIRPVSSSVTARDF